MKKIFCALLLWCVFLIPFRQVFAQSGGILTPFGGHIVDVDYETCDCGFIIYTVYDITTKNEYRIIFPYLLQFLEQLGVDFGDFSGLIPRIYDYGILFAQQDHNVVGNFFPYRNAVCLVITSSGCSTVEGYDGYLVGMGVSASEGQ